MKRLFASLTICLFALSTLSAADHIILRNGQEYDVKLHMLNDELLVFSHIKAQKGEQEELSTRDVYMIYVEGQGNVYIDSDGNRISGESKRANPSKNDVIYLKQGKEIGAENIRITPTEVIYKVKVSPPMGLGLILKPIVTEYSIEKSEVFMIRYRNGVRDIITPIDIVEDPKETETEHLEEPEFIVVFHEVQAGENLEIIAEKYNVTPTELIEWNDIPVGKKNKAAVKIGMQLLIYQQK